LIYLNGRAAESDNIEDNRIAIAQHASFILCFSRRRSAIYRQINPGIFTAQSESEGTRRMTGR
jgi:hypothetical protein